MQVFKHRLADGKPIDMGYYINGCKDSKLESVSKIDGLTIFEAAEKGNMATVASFLLGGVDPNVTERDGERGTPLHYAAKGGEQLVVRFLIDNGAFVDSASGNGSTPLMWGAKAGRVDCCIGLLASGAKANAADDQGLTIAMHAASNPPIMHILQRHDNGKDPTVKLADEITSDTQQTLLHRAAINGENHKSCWNSIMYLCETAESGDVTRKDKGVDVNLRDASGRTALHYACANNDLNGVKALMLKGASNDIKDNNGHIPTAVPTCRSGQIKSFMSSFLAEKSTAKQEKMAQRDFSNWAALDLKQLQHFTVAFFVPNTAVLLASYIPTWIGVFSLLFFIMGFGMVAQFSMKRKVRSMATAGWFSGALAYGSGILFNKVFPVYLECHENHIFYYLWWATVVPMFVCYAWAVLKDPGVVVSTADARLEIYDGIASSGEGEIQRMGYDLTTMVRKPLRSKHCSKTGQCVARFDHFCVWTGNAIGGGNHRQFVWYCLCQAICQAIVMHMTYSYMFICTPKLAAMDVETPKGFFAWIEWMYKDPDHTMVTFFLGIYNSFVFLFVFTVVVSQLWYATRNVTSNEVWFAQRYKWMMMVGSRAHSMYDKGFLGNITGFFCTDDLLQVDYQVPPMNEHMKKISKRYAATLRAASEAHARQQANGGDGHGHSHGTQPAMPSQEEGASLLAGPNDGVNEATAVNMNSNPGPSDFGLAALPKDTQQELAQVQLLLQDLIQGKEMTRPADITDDKWDRISNQARNMHSNFQSAMSGMQGPPAGQHAADAGSPVNPQPVRRKQD